MIFVSVASFSCERVSCSSGAPMGLLSVTPFRHGRFSCFSRATDDGNCRLSGRGLSLARSSAEPDVENCFIVAGGLSPKRWSSLSWSLV